jgi:predicted DNA-binding protein with PD1-like motif
MKVSLVQQIPTHVFAVVLDPGDEVIESITGFAEMNSVEAAHLAAIGAFSRATLAWFNLDTNQYERIPVNEQVEVVSLVGNIAMHEGKPKVHAHVALARRDGSGIGGHILEAYVRPTLEIFVTEMRGPLERKLDRQTTLPLIHL